jgi:hypothetical protein
VLRQVFCQVLISSDNRTFESITSLDVRFALFIKHVDYFRAVIRAQLLSAKADNIFDGRLTWQGQWAAFH